MLSVVSLSTIVVSIVLVCIETLPDIRKNNYIVEIMGHLELGIVIFFTVEYLVRFMVANRYILPSVAMQTWHARRQ